MALNYTSCTDSSPKEARIVIARAQHILAMVEAKLDSMRSHSRVDAQVTRELKHASQIVRNEHGSLDLRRKRDPDFG